MVACGLYAQTPQVDHMVTLQTTISVTNLISFAKAKGSKVEFAGALFGANLRLPTSYRSIVLLSLKYGYSSESVRPFREKSLPCALRKSVATNNNK